MIDVAAGRMWIENLRNARYVPLSYNTADIDAALTCLAAALDALERAQKVADAACDLVEHAGTRLRPNVSFVDFNAAMFNKLVDAILEYAPDKAALSGERTET